jgi:rRNA maturation endonuclease Nob1
MTMTRQLSLYEDRHETLYELRQPDRNMIRCFGCKEIVPEDETDGGFCEKCQSFNEANP